MKCYCGREAEVMCKNCLNCTLFCRDHLIGHISETGHSISKIDERAAQLYVLRSVGLEIEKSIAKIHSDTQNLISVILNISSESIKRLKVMNQNLKTINDYTSIQFDNEKIKFIIEQLQQITKTVKYIPLSDNFEMQPTPVVLGSVKIFAKFLTGKTIELDVKVTESIESVKKKIYTTERVPIEQQKLIFAGILLEDLRTLDYYGITQSSTIIIILCLRAGAYYY